MAFSARGDAGTQSLASTGPGHQSLGGHSLSREATSTLLSSLWRSTAFLFLSCFSPPTVLSPFGVGGEEPDARALSPRGGTSISPRRPPRASLPQRLTAKQTGYLATLPRRSASPWSTTAHPFPACCLRMGRPSSHFLLPSPIRTDMSPSHTGPLASWPPGRRLIGRK